MNLFPKSLLEKFKNEFLVYCGSLIIIAIIVAVIVPFLILSEHVFFMIMFNGSTVLVFSPLIFFILLEKEIKLRNIGKLSWHVVETIERNPEPIDEWCKENNIGRYKLLYETKEGRIAYGVKNQDDAFSFKMRWL